MCWRGLANKCFQAILEIKIGAKNAQKFAGFYDDECF
jgi:hypothetical protein